MGVVMFNGVSSQDLHIQVEHPPEYEYPEKDYTLIHIPGRNGDLVIDNKSYKNVERRYQIAIGVPGLSYSMMASHISDWLHSGKGYCRLEDSYDPEHYRMAMYNEQNNIENIFQQAGRAEITFNCKPQRFLKSGDRKIVLSNNGSISNPSREKALPLIQVNGLGAGELTVTSDETFVLTFSDIDAYAEVDCDLMLCRKGNVNKNSTLTLSNEFPKLSKGITTFSWTGGITSVEITPRWWTI